MSSLALVSGLSLVCSQEVAERRAGGEVQGQGLQSEAE
jgi:hypothetical protein